MADVNKTILVKIGVDRDQFTKEAAKAQQDLVNLQARQRELAKIMREGGEAAKAAGQEFVENKARMKALSKEVNDATRFIQQFDTAVQEADQAFGSLAQKKAEIAALRKVYDELAEAGRENSEYGQDVAANLAQITEEVKKQEAAVGDFRRNVGNYPKPDLEPLIIEARKSTAGIIDMKNAIDLLKERRLNVPIEEAKEYSDVILDLETRIDKATGKIDEFGDREPKNKTKKAFDDLNDVLQGTIALTSAAALLGAEQAKIEEVVAKATAANAIATNAKAIAKTAVIAAEQAEALATKANISYQAAYSVVVGQSTGALKLFRIALATTGIGAILILLGLLIANFGNVTKVVSGFIDKSPVLKTALNVITAPIRLLWEGLKKAAEYFGIVATEAEKARDKMIAGTNDSVSAIEKQYGRQINLAKAAGKETADLEKQKQKDIQATLQKSLNAFEEQKKAGKKLTEDQLKQLKDFQEQQLDSINQVDAINLEADRKASEAKKKLLEETTSKQKQERERIKNEISQLNIEITNITFEQAQRGRTAREQELAEIGRAYDQRRDQAKKLGQDLTKINELEANERKFINDKYDKEAKDKENKAANEQRQFDIQQLEQQLKTAAGNFEQEYKLNQELLDKHRDQELAAAELSETQISAIRQKYRFEQSQLDDQYAADRLARRNELALQLAEVEILNAQDPASRLTAQQAYLDLQYQQEIEAADRLGQDKTLITAQYNDQMRQLDEERYAAATGAINEFGNAFQDVVGKNSKAAALAASIQQKAEAALFIQQNKRAAVEQLLGISSQLKQPFPANIISVAGTLALVAKIASAAKSLVTIPKLATGDIFFSDGYGSLVSGPGSGKSDSINARLSNGESVINANSTAMFKPLLSWINQAGGGKPFKDTLSYKMPALADGGYYDGGYAADYRSASIFGYPSIRNAVRDAVVEGFSHPNAQGSLADAMGKAVSRLTVVTDVRDIVAQQDKINNTINRVTY